jgi:hypothetical protein
MKAFILITLFFSFYFITVKDIYDEKMFLTEDVRILENEIGEKEKGYLINLKPDKGLWKLLKAK